MMPAVISDRVAFVGNTAHDLWPFVGVAAKDKERRLYIPGLQRVENSWRRIRVGTVVERQRNALSGGSDVGDRPPEDVAIRVIDTVRDGGCRAADRQLRDHAG